MSEFDSALKNVRAETRRFLADSLVWDMHGCMPLRPNDQTFLPDLQRCKRSGFDVCCLNIGMDFTPWENAVLVAANFRDFIQRNSEQYLQIETVEDIRATRESERLGVMFDLEGADALNNQLSMVQLYYDLGVRWMLMAYNKNNSVGGGCDDDDQGLTDFGKQVVREMNRVGMVCCCSHTGFKTSMQVLELSEHPVIFSHSNPRALKDHYRNITDEQIKACADTGGVISINGIGDFLGDNDNRSETVVQHIDYVAQLVGTDHVGIALDFVFDEQELAGYFAAHPDVFPPQKYSAGIKMVSPEQMPEIAEGLLDRGYHHSDLQKILGLNHLRIARTVWK